jgi:mono/diheme cytochrome c family protein
VTRAEIGFQTEPGASAVQALVQACGTCHNDVLDQTVSRARFNVAIGRLDRAELDTAIERLEAPQGTPGRMPPSGRRQLDADGLSRLLDYLKRNERSSEDDAFLEHAATVGMVPARLR